ncbi:KH domain-containing, RNA-binding, signal transduction-associated protein 1-like [Nannospalax galili]|uniref:KH domain-containing, RNA-binding, signal transduction-associated protein 1-like n=1 Tax=Nannospalax galili TaxID=1026970 RepID=UPI00111C60DB|nr:KH domain-containing, RNA-binding, signal transduction-associated protein 1-like [Nannospalax galili]
MAPISGLERSKQVNRVCAGIPLVSDQRRPNQSLFICLSVNSHPCFPSVGRGRHQSRITFAVFSAPVRCGFQPSARAWEPRRERHLCLRDAGRGRSPAGTRGAGSCRCGRGPRSPTALERRCSRPVRTSPRSQRPAASQPAPRAPRRGRSEVRAMEEEKYLPELMAEKDSLDPSFVHASRLLAEEIEKFQGSDGKKEDEEKKYLDVISNKNIKLSERVLIPVKQYPKINLYVH